MNRSRITFSKVLLAASLVTLVSFDATHARAEDPKPVVRGPISIQVPAGWTTSDKSDGRALLVALAPVADRDTTGEFRASFSISQEAGGKLDGVAQQNRLVTDIPGYKPADAPKNITVNGLQGVVFSGIFPKDKLNLYARQFIFTSNNQLFVITFTCLSSKSNGYRAAVDASVNTFSLAK